MIEYLKKSLLTGVGMALRSKNEIEEMAKAFAENSKMEQEEAKVFLKECQNRYEDAKVNLDKKIEGAIEKVFERLDLPTKSDIDQLSQRIDDLSKKLSD